MSAPHDSDSATGNGLRIVFFGPSGAGKTALLAVLGTAQEHQLQGRLTDVSQGLTELRKSLGKPSPDGAASFPVTFQPLTDATGRNQPSASAILIDCPGKAAAELLAQPWKPNERIPDGGLSDEVLRADALVLPLDASASAEQIDVWFEQFGIFLRAMEVQRGRRFEVAGFPVFLVLTKCDLLARNGDTALDWMERIEERKREVDEQFRAYLAREEAASGPPVFGAVDVHCWATAARRPNLPGSAKPRDAQGVAESAATSSKSRESYGVAELFRQCLQQAAAYRQRQRRSESRLTWTVGAAVVTAVLMVAVTLGQFFSGSKVKSDLELKVENARFSDRETAADRLKAPVAELNRRVERFQKLREDSGFDALPASEQTFVQDRLTELREYLALLKKIPQPRELMELRSLDDLRKFRDDLKLVKTPPEWADTEVVQRHKERLKDLDALEDAVLTVQGRYRTETDKAGTLLDFKDDLPGPAWLDEARKLLAPDPKASFTPADRIPGSSSLTYGTALAFEDVRSDRLSWERRRGSLAGVSNLIAALGLAGAGVEPPPVLSIPERFTLEGAKEKAALLRKHYPKFATDFTLDSLPPQVRQQVIREARRCYENLLRPVRELVAKEGGATEDWDRVRRWIRKPSELEDWRILAKSLTPLLGGPQRDPIEELDAFLQTPAFAVHPSRLILEVPENSVSRVRPPATAVLTIDYASKSGDKTTLSFALDNTKKEEDRVNRVTRYEFKRSSGRDLLYEPGGELTATVPAQDGRRLTWKNPRASSKYQIERLALEPVLHRENQPVTDGSVEAGVRLLCIEPPDGLPRWPDLLQKTER